MKKNDFNPQTEALELAEMDLKNIGKNGCCAFVFLWCLGIEPDNTIEAIRLVDEALKKGYIEKDCTVLWSKWGTALTGRNIDIEKVNITTISNIKERTPVFYSTKKIVNGILPAGHWVGVENGKIAYNPLKESNNVNNGKPLTLRKIIVKGMVK